MSRSAQRLAAGAGWLYAYRIGERLLDLVSIVVLARLLTPEDFGLVAIAASVVAIIEGLSNFDVERALIRSRDDRRALFDTAWTLSTLRGVLSAVVMAVTAALVPDARIAEVIFALALSPLLKGLSNPRFVTFERELVYSRLAWLTLGSKLVAFAVTVSLAIFYRSYWALVVGILAGAFASLLSSYALRPYRPRFSLSRRAEIFAFSGWMALATLVTTVAMETDKIIVGRLLGIADAGLYFMTQRIGVLPTRELISPLQRILFPSFSEIAHDRVRLRRVVCESVNVFASLSLPAAFGFAWLADELVPLALGDRWLPIVPLLAVLVPFLGLRATLSMALPCLMALGETRLLFRVSVVYAVVHLPVFILGTAIYGLIGAVGGIVVAGLFYIYLSAWLLRRALDISPAEILGPIRRPAVAAALMLAALFALDALMPPAHPSPTVAWASLLARIAAGAAVFVAAQYAVWRLEGRPAGIERRLLQLLSR